MTDLKWWHTAVFYQIYPRSFADGKNDDLFECGTTGSDQP